MAGNGRVMERILQKIGRINEYVNIIETIQHDCHDRFETDPVYRGALLHYLYLMVDTCIVLAEMVIKKKGLRIPQSYSESFDILGDSKVLEPRFAYSFAKIAGFRNFLAHDYDKIDACIICGNVLGNIGDVKTYIMQISESISVDSL